MNGQDILGINSAYEHAKQCTYGANMSISAALVVDMVKRIAELEKELNVPVNLNQFNYAFYKTNFGSVDDFYEWLKKWKHISAKVDENEHTH